MAGNKSSRRIPAQTVSFREPLSLSMSRFRSTTTDEICSLPCFGKFLTATAMYSFLRVYEANNRPKKIFLERTLAYHIFAEGRPARRKRKWPESPVVSDRESKRPKLETDPSSIVSPQSIRSLGTSETEVGNKPFSRKIILQAVFDKTGTSDIVEVEVLMMKTNEQGVPKAVLYENGSSSPIRTVRLPRNPTAHTNGHAPPIITIPREKSPNPMNGFQQRSTQTWLMCRCKLALPMMTSRKGLRDSPQRRANASLAPLKSDYCYGCCTIDDKDGWNSDGKEIEVLMKRLRSKRDGENLEHQINGFNFGPHVLSRMMMDDFDDVKMDHIPTLQIRIFREGDQKRDIEITPMSKSKETRRIHAFCEKLPCVNQLSHVDVRNAPLSSSSSPGSSESETRIFYQFYIEHQQVGHSSEPCVNRLTTKLANSSACAFCYIKCSDLYSLFQHQRCCHPRWSFIVKENYDGYIVEMRPALYGDVGMEILIPRRRISRRKCVPMRKTILESKVLFHKPMKARRTKPARTLDEFKTCPKDNEYLDARKRESALYHTRQYYHSQTCQLLVLPRELDIDSENEMDPEWLRNRTKRLIDEFSDVNAGEKEIMKLWNLHLLKHNIYGDNRMAAACKSFLETHGHHIISKKLTNNFAIHLANLYDYGLLAQSQVQSLLGMLHTFEPASGKIESKE